MPGDQDLFWGARGGGQGMWDTLRIQQDQVLSENSPSCLGLL